MPVPVERRLVLRKRDLQGFRLFQLDLHQSLGADMDLAHVYWPDEEYLPQVQQKHYKDETVRLRAEFKQLGLSPKYGQMSVWWKSQITTSTQSV